MKRFAIWINGQTAWLNSEQWDVRSDSSIVIAYHSEWQLQVTLLQEYLEADQCFVSTFILKNQSERQRELRFIVHRQTVLGIAPSVTFVSPSKQAILHYGQESLFLLAGKFRHELESQLAVGRKESVWNEQTGSLALSPLCQNEHECMISARLALEPNQETYGRIWEIHGHTEETVLAGHEKQLKHDQHVQMTKRSVLPS